MTQLSIGSGPNEEFFRAEDLPLVGPVRRDDILSIIAMEDFDEYGELGFGTAFRLRIDDILPKSDDGCGQGMTGPELQGALIGQFPSWMRRKRIMWAPKRGAWVMNLGDGEWRWSRVMLAVETR